MKKTFYCVKAQFNEFGKRTADITQSVEAEKRPKSRMLTKSGLTTFSIWTAAEINALTLVELIKDMAVGIDDLVSLMTKLSMDQERRAA